MSPHSLSLQRWVDSEYGAINAVSVLGGFRESALALLAQSSNSSPIANCSPEDGPGKTKALFCITILRDIEPRNDEGHGCEVDVRRG